MVKADAGPEYLEENIINGIKIKKIGCARKSKRYHPSVFHIGVEHGLALHVGIDAAANDMLMITNPDLFVYPQLDDFYLDLIEKYELNIIGMSHQISIHQSHGYFPTLFNFVARKSDLPDENFLQEYLKPEYVFKEVWDQLDEIDRQQDFKGKYLVPNKIKELAHLYVKTDGHYETGGNLWLWAKQQNWKWLAFQALDSHLYTAAYNRGNVKLNEKLGKRKLLYHAIQGAYSNHYEELKELYEKELEEWEE